MLAVPVGHGLFGGTKAQNRLLSPPIGTRRKTDGPSSWPLVPGLPPHMACMMFSSDTISSRTPWKRLVLDRLFHNSFFCSGFMTVESNVGGVRCDKVHCLELISKAHSNALFELICRMIIQAGAVINTNAYKCAQVRFKVPGCLISKQKAKSKKTTSKMRAKLNNRMWMSSCQQHRAEKECKGVTAQFLHNYISCIWVH